MATFFVFVLGAAVGQMVSTSPLATLACAQLAVVFFLLAIGQPWPIRLGLTLPHSAPPRSAPPAVLWLASGLLGASVWLLNIALLTLLTQLAPVPTEAPALAQMIATPNLPLVLVTTAILPAIAEELWFRGLWCRGLAQRWAQPVAIVVSSLGFSALHWSLAQAVPTFVLGCVLGTVTLRARSVGPAILAHALNNTIVIIISRTDILGAMPLGAAAAIALLMTTSGLRLLAK